MDRQTKAWWAMPIAGAGIWVSAFGIAIYEPCDNEAGRSAVCSIDWMKPLDDYTTSS